MPQPSINQIFFYASQDNVSDQDLHSIQGISRGNFMKFDNHRALR